MSTSSRLAVAVHVLTLLALNEGQPVTSGCVASSVSTNPVVVRRLLGALRKAGLVTSRPGAGGGARLARPAEEITLLDAYRAVENGSLLSLHSQPPNPYCVCGRNIQPALQNVFSQAEAAMENELSGVTVAQIARDIEALDCASKE